MTSDVTLALVAAVLMLIAMAVELGRARRRLVRWPVVAAPAGSALPDDVAFLTAPGVRLDESLRRAAASHLIAGGLEAVDLLPGDLGIAASLEIASLTDPQALRDDPFARAAGAGCAIAVRESLRLRADVGVPASAPSLAAAAEQLRRHAVGRTGTAVAPRLHAIPERADERAAMLWSRSGAAMGPRLYVEGVRWALAALALFLDPRIGLGMWAIASIAPTLAFAGLPVRPRDRWRSLIERIPRDFMAWMRACLQRDPRKDAIDIARPHYRQLTAAGTASFFEPRRSACPLCAASSLLPHLTATDLVQRKPGRFTLERCTACGLIFQNPALSQEGLAYYYRDFYDGLNAGVMDDVFASTHPLYAARIAAVISAMEGGAAPVRWLDVGCGHGHFSLAARRRLPSTRFEGLDRSASVEEALRRGWLDRAWRMTTTQLVEAGERFDVVTLFHYLEHTQDPAAEIRRARQLLAPAGRLVVEVPNPACRLGRILGRWWFPWFQPQHQVFLDADGVCRLMAAAGLRPSSVTYLMTAGDILLSALIATRRACSIGDVPWAEPPGTLRRAADLAVWAAALPVLAAASAADALYGLLPPSPATSNALRVVAVPIEP